MTTVTDEEIEKMLDGMGEMFYTLPNPEREPKRFAAAVKMFNYIEKQKNRDPYEEANTIHNLTA